MLSKKYYHQYKTCKPTVQSGFYCFSCRNYTENVNTNKVKMRNQDILTVIKIDIIKHVGILFKV